MSTTLSLKADSFRKQHHENNLLLLPNIWDSMSAKVVASVGYQSIATSSAAIAATHGYADGERLPLDVLLKAVSEIARAVDLPLSVDFERGFATNQQQLSENIKRLLDMGAIGINLEDGLTGNNPIRPLHEQCKRIETVRQAAYSYGVNLVINARTDFYLRRAEDVQLAEVIQRAKAYQEAGADCIFPIMLTNFQLIAELIRAINVPVNILLTKNNNDLKKLEEIGVKRVSLGPNFFRFMLTKLTGLLSDFQHYDSSELFKNEFKTYEFLMSES